MAVFELLFFLFKHYIDKYNLTFVYNREFEGGGVIKESVIPFMLFAILMFQILNIGYFAILIPDRSKAYLLSGFVLVLVEIALLIAIK